MRLVQREGHAPDLLALLLAEIVEELDEAGDQVGLGEHGIDRHAHAKLVVQFAHAPANGAGMREPFVLTERGEIGQADRHDDAVERLAAAVLLQQAQEAQPAGAVHAGVAVLRGVAAGRVDQHRLVGEPPVAVAGATHAAHRARAERVGERKAQAAIGQRRGLARAGRADEQVPGKLIQIAPRTAAQLGALQRMQRLAQPSAQQRHLLGRGSLGRIGLFGGDAVHQRLVPLAGMPHVHEVPRQPGQQAGQDDPAARKLGLQRTGDADGEQRPEEPHHQAQQHHSEQRRQPAAADERA